MSTAIYYFSGTGNSQRAARGLKDAIPGASLVPIAGALARSSRPQTAGDAVGFVFPVHGMTVPRVVRDFLEKADLSAPGYFFAVATRGGSVFRGFPVIERLLRRQGKKLNAAFAITMGLNDPKLKAFTVPGAEELGRIERELIEKLKSVVAKVTAREDHREDPGGVKVTGIAPLDFLFERLIPFMVHHVARRVKKYFYADAHCVGCGTCAKVCPAGRIELREKRPFWRPEIGCHMCYACLNFCPQAAVQIHSKVWMKSYTAERGRYPHPYATANDIAAQRERDGG